MTTHTDNDTTYHSIAQPNEIWQDAEGTVYTPSCEEDGWLALGCALVIPEGTDGQIMPMVRLLMANGDLDQLWVNPLALADK